MDGRGGRIFWIKVIGMVELGRKDRKGGGRRAGEFTAFGRMLRYWFHLGAHPSSQAIILFMIIPNSSSEVKFFQLQFLGSILYSKEDLIFPLCEGSGTRRVTEFTTPEQNSPTSLSSPFYFPHQRNITVTSKISLKPAPVSPN